MISCQTFRTTMRPGSDDVNVLEHVRSCDACLDYALAIDPDCFFRSIGGGEMVPPGGVDHFVSDVMAQVRLRQTETSAARRISTAWYMRAAAAAAFVIATASGIYEYQHRVVQAPVVMAAEARPQIIKPTTTKAVVETYQSKDATIVEMPGGSASDPKIVMIYDQSLPADL